MNITYFLDALEMHIISNEDEWSRNPRGEFEDFKTKLNKDQNDAVSDTTKAEQSSTSLPQNPNNWREEAMRLAVKHSKEQVQKFSGNIALTYEVAKDMRRFSFIEGFRAAAIPHLEEIERLREELAEARLSAQKDLLEELAINFSNPENFQKATTHDKVVFYAIGQTIKKWPLPAPRTQSPDTKPADHGDGLETK